MSISEELYTRMKARIMPIEESFRDDQAAGFDLEHTRLEHPKRLEKLLLAVAIATLWCHEIGEHVLQNQSFFSMC